MRDVEYVDAGALIDESFRQPGPRVAWSATNQLQTNLVVLRPGESVDWHAEGELDVTVVALRGTAAVRIDVDQVRLLEVVAPAVVVLPAGTRRSLAAGADGFAYLTAHRRRSPLMPGMPSRA